MTCNLIQKGLGIAGALFLSGCSGHGDAALHDTYYVVAHWHYALQLLATLTVVWGLWLWMMRRFRRFGIWVGRVALACVSVGTLMTLLPTVDFLTNAPLEDQIARISMLNSVAMIGGALIAFAVLLTGLGLGAMAIGRLRRH